MVTIRDKSDYNGVLLYSYYSGWGGPPNDDLSKGRGESSPQSKEGPSGPWQNKLCRPNLALASATLTLYNNKILSS